MCLDRLRTGPVHFLLLWLQCHFIFEISGLLLLRNIGSNIERAKYSPCNSIRCWKQEIHNSRQLCFQNNKYASFHLTINKTQWVGCAGSPKTNNQQGQNWIYGKRRKHVRIDARKNVFVEKFDENSIILKITDTVLRSSRFSIIPTSDLPRSEKEEVETLNALAHPKTTTKSAPPNASEESKEDLTAKNEECEKVAAPAKPIASEADDPSSLTRKAKDHQKASVENPTKKKMKKPLH